MADNQIALGSVTQTGQGAAGTVSAPLYGVTQFTNPSRVTTRIPAYKTNSPVQQTRISVINRSGEITVDGEVSNANIVPFLASGLGPGATNVYKLGVGTPAFLTTKWAEGLAESHQQIDGLVNTFRLHYSVDNPFTFAVQILGPEPTQGAAWSTVATIPTGLVPFDNWQVYITRGGVAACVRQLTITVDNRLQPLYCSPSALPGATTPAGLTPARFYRGPQGINTTWDALYYYTGYAGSSAEALALQNPEVWQVHALDGTGTASVQIDLPRVGVTSHEIQREGINWGHAGGTALLDNTAATALTVTIV